MSGGPSRDATTSAVKTSKRRAGVASVWPPTFTPAKKPCKIASRRFPGAELEPALVDSFVERIEQRLVERDEQQERALRRKRDHQKEMVLGAMALGIPLMAIAAIFTGLAGVIVVAAAIVAVAIVTAR
jgi:hypothetical protein